MNTNRSMPLAMIIAELPSADVREAVGSICPAFSLHPPADHPYGERQYVVADIGGHRWTSSQSRDDIDLPNCGGTLFI